MRFIEAQGALRKQTFKVRDGNLKSRIELLHAFGTDRLLFGNFSYHSTDCNKSEILRSAIARGR